MKNLLALLILFSTMLTKQPEYISIEHIGISDKPIATIIISKDKIVNSDTENFTVTSEDYAALKGAILSNTKADYKGHEFGSFKIAIKNTTEKDLYHCLNRQKSIELLNKLIKTLEKKNTNNELLSRLEIVKKRIVY
jgi:hypothetical protein